MKKNLQVIKQEDKATVEIILPLPEPETRGQFIEQRAEQYKRGELTAMDTGKELKLSMQQIKFATLYVSEDFFGDGVNAAALAYGHDLSTRKGKSAAYHMANINLKHANVLTLINVMLSTEGFNNQHMDKQLLFLCTQNNDLKAKGVGLKTYNEITGRLKKSLEITVKPAMDLSKLDDQELKVMIELLRKTRVTEN